MLAYLLEGESPKKMPSQAQVTGTRLSPRLSRARYNSSMKSYKTRISEYTFNGHLWLADPNVKSTARSEKGKGRDFGSSWVSYVQRPSFILSRIWRLVCLLDKIVPNLSSTKRPQWKDKKEQSQYRVAGARNLLTSPRPRSLPGILPPGPAAIVMLAFRASIVIRAPNLRVLPRLDMAIISYQILTLAWHHKMSILNPNSWVNKLFNYHF